MLHAKDGSIENDFGHNGRSLVPHSLLAVYNADAPFDVCTGCQDPGLMVDGHGRVLISGVHDGNQSRLLVRIRADGKLSPTYGDDGIAIAEIPAPAGFEVAANAGPVLAADDGSVKAVGSVSTFDHRGNHERDTFIVAAFDRRGNRTPASPATASRNSRRLRHGLRA